MIAIDMEAVRALGKTIAGSEVFGKMTAAAGEVVAVSVLRNGLDLIKLQQDFDYMHKKFSMKSQTMLGKLIEAGGTFEIIERTPEAAEIRVTIDGRQVTERFTWQEAQEEPFVYEGKQSEVVEVLLNGDRSKLKLSSNYATPRRRGQHLWARVVSDSIRTIAPNLISGAYTPEEVASFSPSGSSATEHPTEPVEPVVTKTEPAATQVDPAPQPEREPDTRTSIGLDEPCTDQQADMVRAAIKEFGQTAGLDALTKLKSRLSERGIENAKALTVLQADALVDAIKMKTLKAYFEKVLPVREPDPS